MADHKDLTAASVHVVGYQQVNDPGAIGAGRVWLDTNYSPAVMRVRNSSNSGWDDTMLLVYDGSVILYDETDIYL